MRTNRIWFTLSACLLVGILEGWLLGHYSSNPQMAIPPSQTASDSIPVAETVAQPTPLSESSREVGAEASQPKPEIRQPSADLASVNLGSPINSQDLDQNREWARNYPSDALAWLQNAPDSTQRVAIAEIVCPQLAQTNAVAAVKLAENCLGEGTNNAAQYLLGTVAQIWAEQDLKSATAWALAKPDGEQRDLLLQHIAFAESKTDPVEAARLVAEQMSPGSVQNEAAVTVVYQWAQQDAKAALAWAESFPAGDLRDRAINEVKNVSATSAGNLTTN